MQIPNQNIGKLKFPGFRKFQGFRSFYVLVSLMNILGEIQLPGLHIHGSKKD